MATARPAPDRSLTDVPVREKLDLLLLRRLDARMGSAPLRYALGRSTLATVESPVATLRFRDRRALLGLLVDPEIHFGDAYAEGRIEIEGDLVTALEAAYRALGPGGGSKPFAWLATWRRHSPPRARANVQHHYDLGNDFYALWLDEQLLYTGAYFESPGQSLEEAQVAKMDHVCRKLGLRPGETVVEAGCGWGALALHMAQRYGARVRAYNVSREQVAWARERARREGLDGRVEFVEDDYRAIRGRCDAFVSVGMLEHVGRRSYRELGRVIARALDPARGRGLLHFIGRDRPRPLNAWIRRRIFPGAYPPALAEVDRDVLGPEHLAVVDVENLRPHYALTLRHWRERYERAAADGRVGRDERFRRTWRLYLAGSEAAFRTGSLQLFQVVFARRGGTGAPWTRRGLYDGGPGLPWNAPTS
ncbi:MAG TPA: cyclopropane-fatty-acyl-phospholipid synthase family protein [Vicinamibacteria bacterium]|nr:cyclopropane-fatty-acyl-phospholipid synthase family protein [Vicinamibacteria bacterium]